MKEEIKDNKKEKERNNLRYSYSSIDSSGSSSSSDDENNSPITQRSSLLKQYSKRLYSDSTSNLKELENNSLLYYEQDLEDSEVISNPKYVDFIKIQFFSLGFVSGAALQMFCVSVLLMFVSYSQHSGPLLELSHEYYPVFRCMFFISFFFSLYGGVIFIWRRAKIEYRSVLGVGSSHTYQYVLRGAASSAIVMFTCFMLYVLTLTGGLEGLKLPRDKIKHLWPALAFLVPLFMFFCPYESITQLFFGDARRSYTQRMGLVSNLIAVLFSPLSKVTFLRSFIADILCSMPKVFTDFQYTLCIYTTGTFWDVHNEWLANTSMHAYDTCGSGSIIYVWLLSLLSFVPYYIRLMQSLRMWIDTGESKHLFNGLKYTMSLSVTGIALAHKVYPSIPYLDTLWFCVSILTTGYAFYWDVIMDWGLGETKCSYIFLREQLYFQPHTYYTAIVLDLLMRLGWAILISPEQTYVEQHIILLLGCIEILRRSMWAIFRVEWEWIKIQKKNLDEIGFLDPTIDITQDNNNNSDDKNDNNNNNNNNNNNSHLYKNRNRNSKNNLNEREDGINSNRDTETYYQRGMKSDDNNSSEDEEEGGIFLEDNIKSNKKD